MAKAKTKHGWILLRGLARETRHWGPFLDSFQRAFPDEEIECLDLAGNGDQASRASYLTLPENTDDLRERSRLLQEGAKISILAISMGGMVALDWAKRFPEEIDRVVAINTSNRFDSRYFERLRPRNYVPLLKLVFDVHRPERIETTVLKITTHLLPDLRSRAREQSKIPVTSALNFARQLIAASRFRMRKAPKIPMLFLVSRRDDLVNPVCTRRLARDWNSPLIEHPLAGHDLTLDAPDWVAEQVQRWCGVSRDQSPPKASSGREPT